MRKLNKERRNGKRQVKVSLVQANSYVIGSTADLSLGGARIELPRALPVQTPVRLDLLAGDSVLEIVSTVVHVQKLGEDRYSAGLKFGQLEATTLRLLEEFLASPVSPRQFTVSEFKA